MKNLVLALALTASLPALAKTSSFSCNLDYTEFGFTKVSIEVKTNENKYQLLVDGNIANEDSVEVYTIRDNLNLAADPYSPESDSFNFGERLLSGLHGQEVGIPDPENEEELMTFPSGTKMNLSKVKTLKVYQLQKDIDQFGGSQVVEAYDKDNNLLERLGRIFIFQTCK